MEYKTPLVIIFFQTVHRMIGRPAIVIFLLGLSFSEARVDFNHSKIYDEFDFKGQSTVTIDGLCRDTCHIYASITQESKALAANLLIQTAKGFVSVADVAGRVDPTTNQKLYLEVNNTASLAIVNANSQLAAGPLVLYVVNQAGVRLLSLFFNCIVSSLELYRTAIGMETNWIYSFSGDVSIHSLSRFYFIVPSSPFPLYFFQMASPSCVFSILKPSVTLSEVFQFKCNGSVGLIGRLCSWERAYSTHHAVDTMLMRGGIFIDWTDSAKANEVLAMSVCSLHEEKLLTRWKKNSLSNKYNKQKRLTCSLHKIVHEQGVRPVTLRRLNKEDILSILSSTGQFLHVGTAVCHAHEEIIRSQKWNELVFDKEENEDKDDTVSCNGQLDDDEDYSVPNEMELSEPNDDFNDAGSLYSFSADADTDLEAETQIAISGSGKTTRKEVDEAIGVVASFYGIKRLKSNLKWEDMQADTRRKKVGAMLALQDQLYRLCAGDSWETMKKECLRKIGQVMDSSRVDTILQSFEERLFETPDRRGRLNLLSVITGHFSEKEIRSTIGVSRYYIQEAKKFALWGLDDVSNYRRVRYNLQNLKIFISFISRPEVMITLPKPGRVLNLTSGEAISHASVARLHSYRQVFAMYKMWMEMQGQSECTDGNVQEFVRSHSLGYSTAVKLMEALMPARMKRMQCVDSFMADALEAFDSSLSCVTELKEKQKIDNGAAQDLTRRLTVAKNYLMGYFKMHLSVSSTCPSHCLNFALSDSRNPEYQQSCDHIHDDECEQCNEILSTFAQFKAFLVEKSIDAINNQDNDRYRMGRMVEECGDAETKVNEYQKHIVRSAMSEMDRISMIDSLDETWAMLTMDFSLKLMPSGFVEAQSAWFGKCGISFHVTHVLIRKGEQKFNHTLGHLNDDPKQDCAAVCAIADHVFRVLSENGVKIVVVRSDNAGNYRNAGVIFTLRQIASKYGMTLSAYLFSEPQSGKGSADRKIGDAKRKLVSVVDSGGYGRNAEEILKSLTTSPLLKAYSFYRIRGELVKRADSTIDGITNLSSFRYEDDGIRVRKHDSIGTGLLIPFDNLSSIDFKYEILGKGGIMSKSDNFWGDLTDSQPRQEKIKDQEEEVHYEEEKESFFRCPEEGCTAKYRRMHYLNNHLILGKHKFPKHSDTVIDAAAKMFAESVESNESAYLSMRNDSFSSTHPSPRTLQLEEGWAVRVKNKTTLIDPSVRRAVRRYFIDKRKEGQRAEAREIAVMIRNATDPSDGHYLYPLKKCLKESQAQGLISRFLRVEASPAGLKALESDGEEELEEDSDEEGDGDSVQVVPCAGRAAMKAKRGRPKKCQVTTGKKTTTVRKSKPTASQKSIKVARGKKKKVEDEAKASEQNNNEEGDNEEDNGTEETTVANTADIVGNDEASRNKRARSKKTRETGKITKKNSKKGASVKVDEVSSRVTRSQKRKLENEMNYCELASDEELDDFTLFMNAAIEHKKELFTDGEEEDEL